MKKFAIIAVLGAAFVLPAQAQSVTFGQDAYAQGTKAKQKTAKKMAKQRQAAPKPCAARYWGGCLGWDPDPHVRAMIQHDRNIWDD